MSLHLQRRWNRCPVKALRGYTKVAKCGTSKSLNASPLGVLSTAPIAVFYDWAAFAGRAVVWHP